MDRSFKTPFVMQICGPSQSGKSSFAARLIINAHDLCEQPIAEVDWFSPHGNLPDNLLKSDPKTTPIINIYRDLPRSWESNRRPPKQKNDEDSDEEENYAAAAEYTLPTTGNKHRLIVLDDFGDEAKNSNAITALYTRGAHHLNISVIQILQNIFWRGGHSRTRSLNVQYFVLMRQTRDYQQIKSLAAQLTRNSKAKKAFMKAYEDAISRKPYGYLFVSVHPRDHPRLLLRTNIFPDDNDFGLTYRIPGTKYKRYSSPHSGEEDAIEEDET